jgi:hypothetical protein
MDDRITKARSTRDQRQTTALHGRQRSIVYGLSSIVLLYLLLATAYSLVTPLGEGPDEPGHAKYVFFLAQQWRLPVQCQAPCTSDVPGEGHQPPLAYALAAPALLWLPQEERAFDLPGNRRFVWSGGSDVNAVGHGTREHWPWQGMVLGWHLARLVNVALGAATVVIVVLTGRRLFGDHAGLMAGALVAFNPQFLFTSGLLTNDALLVLLCALLVWLVVGQGRTAKPRTEQRNKGTKEQKSTEFDADPQLQERGKSGLRTTDYGLRNRSRAVAIGVVFGLALITKQSALLLGPLVFVWCLLGGQQNLRDSAEPRNQ